MQHNHRKAILLEQNISIMQKLNTGTLDPYEKISQSANVFARLLLLRVNRKISNSDPLPETLLPVPSNNSVKNNNIASLAVSLNSGINPQFTAIEYKAKGNHAFKLQQFERAINSYDLAIKKDKTLKEAWFNRALCLIKLNRNQLALDDLVEAVKLDLCYTKAIYHQVKHLISRN